MVVFWDVAWYSQVDTEKCFSGANCVYHQGDHQKIPEHNYFIFIAVRTSGVDYRNVVIDVNSSIWHVHILVLPL